MAYVRKTKPDDGRRNNLKNMGDKRNVGRPKGAKNLVSKTVKEDILSVYHRLGGANGLYKWCKAQPSNLHTFYRSMFSLLPKDISIETNVTHSLSRLNDEELLGIIKRGYSIASETIDITEDNRKRMLTESGEGGDGSEG